MECIAQGVAVFGKGGRVEDDKVVLVAHALQIFESIFGKGLVAGVAGKVQFDVLVGQVDGLGRTVYRVNQCRASAHGIDRETSGIAEHIEHVASAGITLQQRTVFTLVYKETGLLSLQPVDVEVQTIFGSYVVGASTFQETVLGIEVGLERQGIFRLVVNVVNLVTHHLGQRFGYGHALQVHTGRVGLHHGGAGIDVDDQSGQVVAFTMYQPVGVVIGALGNTDAAAHVVGGAQLAFPEFGINGFVGIKCQYAYGNAANLKMSFGYEFLFGSIDFHHFALFGLTVNVGNGSREYPGVKAFQ